MLSFSGGGTRAAALSYGVHEALWDVPVRVHDEETRLLDEADWISGVSGGSYTVGYYGLFRDWILAARLPFPPSPDPAATSNFVWFN
jgi:NTE family protein